MARKKTMETKGVKGTLERVAREGAQYAEKGQTLVREAWEGAVERFTTAEAAAEKQVRKFIKSRKLSPPDAQALIAEVRTALQKERKRVLKQVHTRLGHLQARAEKERKVAARLVDDAVRGALVAFNIPSRTEVAELTRKVDQLSARIDAFRRPARKAAVRRPRVTKAAA